MAGRKPVPTKLKVVRGTAQPCRTNQDEPKPANDHIKMPLGLSKRAKSQWRKVCRQLQDAEIITNVDTHALAMYCEAFARWAEANQEIERFGAVVKSPSGFPVQSPYLQIANKAFDQMKGMLIEFGMTPSSRTKVSRVKKEQPDDKEWGEL